MNSSVGLKNRKIGELRLRVRNIWLGRLPKYAATWSHWIKKCVRFTPGRLTRWQIEAVSEHELFTGTSKIAPQAKNTGHGYGSCSLKKCRVWRSTECHWFLLRGITTARPYPIRLRAAPLRQKVRSIQDYLRRTVCIVHCKNNQLSSIR